MDWRALRQILLEATGFDMELKGKFGQSKTINLTVWPNNIGGLTFKTLGSGSMKRVVRVEGEDWVLALAGDSLAATQDMQGEVKALKTLAAAGVRVPEPFVTGEEGEILFELTLSNQDSGDTKTYPAFLQQFLPYQEMDKLKNRGNFAKDFIVNGSVLPPTLDTTIGDLEKILARLEVREWGDFQVIYQKITGYVYVFDPLPENNSGVSSIPIVKKWLSDIDAAKKARKFPVTPGKTTGGAWEV